MKFAQFLLTVDKDGGRERMARNIRKALDAEIYALNSDNGPRPDLDLASDPQVIREEVRRVEDLNPDLEFLDDVDVVFTHNMLAPIVLEDRDVEVVSMNHGAAKEYTFLADQFLDSMNPSRAFFVRENLEEIREIFGDILSRADVLAANSRFVQEQLQKYFGLDSHLIYDPMDRKQFTPGEGQDDFFLSVQRLVWSKRMDRQLEAFQEIDEEIHIIGSGPLEDRVRDFASRHENIKFLGEVSEERLLSEYRNAAALVHTGLAEECSNVVRESLACGTPVVAREVGANPELVSGDTGVLYEDSLVDAVKNMDPDRYDAEALRESTKKYGLNSFSLNLKKLFNDGTISL